MHTCDVDAAREAAMARFAAHVAAPANASASSPEAIEASAVLLLPRLLAPAEIDELLGAAHGDAGCRYSDTHTAKFLHAGGRFARTWPVLCGRLVAAMRSRPCGVSVSTALSIRCVELHTYTVGGSLLDPGHRDRGSALSMSVLLSDPADFDGGEFLAASGGRPVVHRPSRGDALLFHSEKVHNVATVTRGVRQSLVIELWVADSNEHDRYS